MFRDHNGSAIVAVEKHGVQICQLMNETQYTSMPQAGNINGKHQEVIARHLPYHLDKEFLPTKNSVTMLCEGHAELYCGHVMHK